MHGKEEKMRKKHTGSLSLVFPNRMYFFIIPALAMFLVFWIFPVLQLFYYSVTNFNGINFNDMKYVGLSNYETLIQNGTLLKAVKNTLLYTGIIVIGTNVLGLAVAMALNVNIRGKAFFRTCSFLPALFSAVVVGFIWSYVYMPGSGMVAALLNLIGLDGASFNILGNYKTALYGISIVDIWKGFGTTMLIYLAGLQTVDEGLIEAGKIDGCSDWQLFRKIKLPLISSTITINVILNIIAGLKAFDYPFMMTNGGPGTATNTLMYVVFKIGFNERRMGMASALSVISFFVIILITIGMLYIMNKREVEL